MKKYRLVLSALVFAALLGLPASATNNHLTGKVDGIETVDNDGFIDGALVLPSVKAESILQFDIQNLLAPNEPMTAGPKTISVPGNLYFPEQTENYVFFPITLSKDKFSFYPQAGAKDELYALSFRVPMDDLVKMSQDKAPFTDMVPLIQLRKFAFEGLRDWSSASNVTLNTNGEFVKNAGYSWNRSAAPQNSADLAVAFQKTPAGRWMITDLAGKPASSGQFASSAANSPETKIIFLRLTNEDRMPVAAVGHIRNGGANQRVEVGELPAPLRNAKITRATSTVVSWTPVGMPGWMAILRSAKTAKIDISAKRSVVENVACSLASAFQRLFGHEGRCEPPAPGEEVLSSTLSTRLETWVDGNAGHYTLSSPLASGETLTLIHVGTDREVPAPTTSGDGSIEPELFTYAKELRMVRLK